MLAGIVVRIQSDKILVYLNDKILLEFPSNEKDYFPFFLVYYLKGARTIQRGRPLDEFNGPGKNDTRSFIGADEQCIQRLLERERP